MSEYSPEVLKALEEMKKTTVQWVKRLEIQSIPLDELPLTSFVSVLEDFRLMDVSWKRSEDGKYHPTFVFYPLPPAYGVTSSVSELEQAVIKLIVHKARHKKKGTVMGEETWQELLSHMDEETGELLAVVEKSHLKGNALALEELGDIYGLLVHATIKAGFSMDQVEQRELAKLKERFEYEKPNGAIGLPQPGDSFSSGSASPKKDEGRSEGG